MAKQKPIPALAYSNWLTFKVRTLSWTGFQGKSLWDWLQVVLIPVVLAIYAMNLSVQQTVVMQQQNRIADEQLKSQTLQNYTSTIQDLILHENLLQSKTGDNVRIIATTQTTLALRQLNNERRGNLLLFIYQLRLIDTADPTIDLSGADLSGAYLSGASLNGASLNGANLSGADLSGADLSGADLSGADLSGADLSRADLSYTNLAQSNLNGANLTGATVADEQLRQAKSLQGATMPDGSIHS